MTGESPADQPAGSSDPDPDPLGDVFDRATKVEKGAAESHMSNRIQEMLDDPSEIDVSITPARFRDGNFSVRTGERSSRSSGEPVASDSRMFERFTDRARRVLVLAQEEARLLDHNFIGTEHILLGLIHEGEGAAAQVLQALGADPLRVRQQVIQMMSGYRPGQQDPAGVSVGSTISSPPRAPRLHYRPRCPNCLALLDESARWGTVSAPRIQPSDVPDEGNGDEPEESEKSEDAPPEETELREIGIVWCIRCGKALDTL